MDTVRARLNSFQPQKKSLKKSTSSASSSGSRWPHPSSFKATPKTLAEAGFYFSPSPEYPDNVVCFMCDKELSEWDKQDDPFELHWRKCGGTCAWASARCGLSQDFDEDGNFVSTDAKRLPASKTIEKARLDTFRANKSWPHDAVKSHGASSKRMAKAGFVYNPESSGDDTAECYYCNIRLSNWENDDDPIEEHRKRAEKAGCSCPFFLVDSIPSKKNASQTGTRTSSKTQATSRSRSRPPSRSTSTRPPSRSTKAKDPNPASADELEMDADEDEDDEDEIDMLVTTKGRKSTKTPATTRSTVNASTSRKSTRTMSALSALTTTGGTSRTTKTSKSRSRAGTEASQEQEVDEEDSPVQTKAAKKAGGKGKRTRKTKERNDALEEAPDNYEVVGNDMVESQKDGSKKRDGPQADVEMAEAELPVGAEEDGKKKRATKKGGKTRNKATKAAPRPESPSEPDMVDQHHSTQASAHDDGRSAKSSGQRDVAVRHVDLHAVLERGGQSVIELAATLKPAPLSSVSSDSAGSGSRPPSNRTGKAAESNSKGGTSVPPGIFSRPGATSNSRSDEWLAFNSNEVESITSSGKAKTQIRGDSDNLHCLNEEHLASDVDHGGTQTRPEQTTHDLKSYLDDTGRDLADDNQDRSDTDGHSVQDALSLLLASSSCADMHLTVEQWIRREIELQDGQLRSEGERKIKSFLQRGRQVKKEIEAL